MEIIGFGSRDCIFGLLLCSADSAKLAHATSFAAPRGSHSVLLSLTDSDDNLKMPNQGGFALTVHVLGVWNRVPSILRELVLGVGIVVLLSQPVLLFTERSSNLSGDEINKLGSQLLKMKEDRNASLAVTRQVAPHDRNGL